MDDRQLRFALRSALKPSTPVETIRWQELADESRREGDRLLRRRALTRRCVAAAVIGVAAVASLSLSTPGRLARWLAGGSGGTEVTHPDETNRIVQVPAPGSSDHPAESGHAAHGLGGAASEAWSELERQAAVNQAVVEAMLARRRAEAAQREMDALPAPKVEVVDESQLAAARAATWLVMHAERRQATGSPDEQAEVEQTYRRVVRNYPDTMAAVRAGQWLAQRGELNP